MRSRYYSALPVLAGGGAGGAAPGPFGTVWASKIASTHATASVRHMGQIEFGNDRIVAASYDRIFLSTDAGGTFSENTVTGHTGYLAYSPTLDRFVAWFQSTGLWYSTNGTSWTQSSVTSLIPGGVVWAPWASKFIAMRFGTTRTAYWSADGITWETPETAGVSGSCQNIFLAPDHVITCSGTGTTRRCASQGTWTTVTGAAFSFEAVWCGDYGWRLINRASSNLLYSSADGTAFTSLGAVMPSTAVWRGLAWDDANERLFAWANGLAHYSDDGGSTWSANGSGTLPAYTITETYPNGGGGVDPSTGIVYANGDALYASAA